MDDVFAELLANPTVHMVGIALALAGIALWLAAAWWAYQDANRRFESTVAGFAAAGWIILSTPLLLPIALAVYGLARPQATASDVRTVGLMARLSEVAAHRPTCPGCSTTMNPDWLRCPSCATWFATACDACGQWAAAGLDLCPFCGAERQAILAGPAAAGSPAETGSTADAGHGTAAAGEPAAAGGATKAPRLQRDRMASSLRPASYEASRASSSVSS